MKKGTKIRTRWQGKRARRNQGNTLEKRPDRSERELQLYLGASVSFELPLSSASLPPSTKLSGTEHHCQAATSLPHQNILHCLHLQLCSSMFNRLSPDGRVSQKPWTHRGWKSTPSLHIASTCIHLQFSGTSRPLAILPSPLVQSSLFNTFETPLGCLPPTDLAAHWKPRNENRIQQHFCCND